MKSLLNLFQTASANNDSSAMSLAEKFWLYVPRNVPHLQKIMKDRKQMVTDDEIERRKKALQTLQDELVKQHRDRGNLTKQMERAITNLNQGIIEVGHQPLFLGGGSFVFNKIIFTHTLAEKTNASPLLFVGDHDSVQNELLITRFPQANTDKALSIQYKVHPSFNDSPIWSMERPQEESLNTYLTRIKNNYTNLFRYGNITKKRDLLDERLEGLLSIIKQSYYQSSTLADWSRRIWETILVHYNELGIPTIAASNKKLRKLLLPSFERLLKEKNREKHIKLINQTREQIIQAGYDPGFGERSSDHLPFFIECPACERHTRMEGKLEQPGKISAECSFCAAVTQIEYNPTSPDLSDWTSILSPRVDTRTFFIADTFPIDAHVGGTGELIYHAQVYPAYKEFITPPVFLKYNAIHYNTPWIEKTAQEQILKNNTLQTGDFLTKAAKISSLNPDEINEHISEIEAKITGTYQNLLNQKQELQEEFSKDHDLKILENMKTVAKYLSQAYGHYTKGKYKQTVSWNWIDLTVLTKVNDLAGTYKRMFDNNMSYARNLYYVGSKYT